MSSDRQVPHGGLSELIPASRHSATWFPCLHAFTSVPSFRVPPPPTHRRFFFLFLFPPFVILIVSIMAASTQDTLESIERRRAQLQDSVAKLRKALAHWSTWEAEYQMLTEEVQSVEDATPTQIRTIAQNLDSSLLDGKEIEELLGKDLHTKRTANQVIDMISRRIDYVQQNSATIEKQLDAAEKQLAGVDILLEPGMENEEGLPMMDIEEELDEQGNAIASHVSQTGKAAAEIAEVLRKVGLQKSEMEKQKQNGATQTQQVTSDPASSTALPTTSAKTEDPIAEHRVKSGPLPDGIEAEPSKKSVSFAEDTKPEMPAKASALEQDGYNDGLSDMNFTRGTKVIELDQDDNELASYPIIPQGESPEDAELRRQMLQYGLSEVGQIVAELDLDNPTAEYSEDEDYETEDEEYEDEYGRNMKPVVTDEYRKQMLELENKLNARMMENVGPEHSSESLAEHADEIRTLRIRKDEQFDQSLDTAKAEPTKTDTKKKGVRFADALDVSEAPQPVPQPTTPAETWTKAPPTISDTIVERPVTGTSAATAPTKPAKVSRFKSSRSGASQPPQVLPTPPIPAAPVVPSGPAGRTLAKTIVEHDASTTEPNAPDEFDPAVINREIQTEYHKARNRFIQQHDGFKPTQEDKESPIVEEKDGKTKKVSRFMAARLKGDGM
jgi:unconventional prefoldin RPB5 interactor 1